MALLRIHEIGQPVTPYVQIARPDHWIKNVFMLFGVLLAWFYVPTEITSASVGPLILAFMATCLMASSNYVLNELVDAPGDRVHPKKRHRPVPSGMIQPAIGMLECFLLAAGGLGVAYWVVERLGKDVEIRHVFCSHRRHIID